LPLFDAAVAVAGSDPGAFPIRQAVSLVVTSAEPLLERDGYGPAVAMIEVLVDAGLLADERQVETERYRVDPQMRGYSVSIGPV
jgi:hypothetical protein